MTSTTSRRSFLQALGGLAAAAPLRQVPLQLSASLAGLAALSGQAGHAADSSGGYKAIVCLFLHGGNDSHNWVVPTDPDGYAGYLAARRELAWPLEKLLPLTVTSQAAGRSFGMPTDLAPLHKWYEGGRAAVVANVGPLLRPLTRTEFLTGVGLPAKLFSHNDQASTWQSMWPEGAVSGWGGRMGDLLMSANAYPVFTAISTTGNAVFLTGRTVSQYQVGPSGPVAISGLAASGTFGANGLPAALQRTLTSATNDPLQVEYKRILQRSMDTGGLLQTALAGTSVPAIPTTTIALGSGGNVRLDRDALANQLRMVVQLLSAGERLGMRRQVFMVSMPGFDTHANQMRDQPSLMARVAHSVDYFLSALSALGLLDKVTLFTASEFGRALLSNGSGCDHGWGSHHVVAGGSVAGRNIHGRFPVPALGTADDVGSGRLLPSYDVAQLAAPLGRWMGLSDAEVATVLPRIGNFDAQALRFI
jgi:uncharacterized protein (DUF1501 family)